ncbi:hypothetical protein CsSME_00032383 [Camellia sinensis var. sinensis]
MEGLFKYYKEVSDDKINLDLNECGLSNSAIAYLLEETTLSLSKLVDQIYEKMRARESGSASRFSTTVASMKSTVLFIRQRSLYGVPNADADILEDETESCLWCWEVLCFAFPPGDLFCFSQLFLQALRIPCFALLSSHTHTYTRHRALLVFQPYWHVSDNKSLTYRIQPDTYRESAAMNVKFSLAGIPVSIRLGPTIFRYEPASTARTGRYLEP